MTPTEREHVVKAISALAHCRGVRIWGARTAAPAAIVEGIWDREFRVAQMHRLALGCLLSGRHAAATVPRGTIGRADVRQGAEPEGR